MFDYKERRKKSGGYCKNNPYMGRTGHNCKNFMGCWRRKYSRNVMGCGSGIDRYLGWDGIGSLARLGWGPGPRATPAPLRVSSKACASARLAAPLRGPPHGGGLGGSPRGGIEAGGPPVPPAPVLGGSVRARGSPPAPRYPRGGALAVGSRPRQGCGAHPAIRPPRQSRGPLSAASAFPPQSGSTTPDEPPQG